MECVEDTGALMKRRTRVVDLAGDLNDVKVELNGTLEDYAKLYLGTSADDLSIYERVNDILEICVVIADGNCEQVSFVNNVATMKVESHVDYITGQITSYLGKIMNLEPNYIKSHLWVFVNASFDLHTKENLMEGSFRSMCKLTAHFLKKIANLDVMNKLSSYADFKENQILEKSDGKEEWKLKRRDAYFAATTYSEDCTLILTSNKTYAECGLSVVGQEYYGIFPLKGKLLNVREASCEKLRENTVIQNIKKILGLEDGKIYKDAKELRYGHLMIMVDQDHDGSYFKGLLINFLHLFWPSLLKVPNFILDFTPPIVKAIFTKESKNVLQFYTVAEYEAWQKDLGDKATEYKIKYRKGLVNTETEEVIQYFADLDNYTKEFVWVDDEDGDAIEFAFDKKIGQRKYWLQAHQACDSKEKRIRYRDFINKELVPFLNQMSIPSIVDGLKLGQRKILFSAFEWPIIEPIQVSTFSSYVFANSAYYEGNMSLVDTIIGMAQKYVGSNNINLLQPQGHFGTRRMGGKDHATEEDIFTQLSPITRYIFHKADELLLNYLKDNGQSIEPEWFIPIIPMVLVNGSEGRGIGWSSFIPNYNPRDIIANLIHLLDGEAMVPMKPWYKGFKGDIQKKKNSGYTTRGMIREFKDTNALVITELPVGMWTRKYEEILQAARQDGKDKTRIIKAYIALSNHHEKVLFKIDMTEDQINTAKEEGLWKKLKLTTTLILSTTNMHLFDANGVIKKYDTPEQILKEFFDIRLPFYEKRLTAQRCKLEKAIKLLKNTERYVSFVRDRKIHLLKPVDMLLELEKNEFEKVEEGYDYLLSLNIILYTKEKLEQEIAEKEKELDALKVADPKSLWKADLVALDEQLHLDGNYPPAKTEAPKKKAPAKRTAASPLPERANKKRLEQ